MNLEPSLNLGIIGNCQISALVDFRGRIVWSCFPRFDGDAVFHSLVGHGIGNEDRGDWTITLENLDRSEQIYLGNTAILRTRLFSGDGSAVDIIDFCPRFMARDRMYRPQMIVRRVVPVSGSPRIRISLRPSFNYGALRPDITQGSNHIRYVGPHGSLRLTTTAPITYVLAESSFILEEPLSFLLGQDEILREGVEPTAREFLENTDSYWRTWTRRLALPLEWQQAVLRAAITLKLCTFEDTGAIVAAMTTSIPEAPSTGRNWDYRYCWLRDAFFVVRALNSLSEVETMENYLRFISNIVSRAPGDHLQPVYGVALETRLNERETALTGYRGMGPVRVGNQAYEHLQHDVYGNVVLASTQAFFDRRLMRPANLLDFEQLEHVGERAYKVYSSPDASMWELRTRARVHTSSALMCWAACDRLTRIAIHFGRSERASLWQSRADEIRAAIEENAWNPDLNSFVDCFGGTNLDASILLIAEVGFLPAKDPRFASTVAAVERFLRRERHLYRYHAADDFGTPTTAFNVCTFWYIDALARLGRVSEARELFESILGHCNHFGLLSEDIDPVTGELWGNYPQTYSLVGIINAATRLSRHWDNVI